MSLSFTLLGIEISLRPGAKMKLIDGQKVAGTASLLHLACLSACLLPHNTHSSNLATHFRLNFAAALKTNAIFTFYMAQWLHWLPD